MSPIEKQSRWPSRRGQTQQWKAVGSFGTVGLEVVLCMLAGFFGGRWLDGKLGTEPYLAVVGFFFGIAAGAKAIFRGWREMQEITAREEREQGNPAPLLDPGEESEDAKRRPEERRQPSEPLDDAAGLDQEDVQETAGRGASHGESKR
jgi:hypothetical protein